MVYVFFAEGFEEIEALTVVDVLRRADIRTHMIGLKGMHVTGSHGITVQMDDTIKSISSLSDTMMMILPGGMPGAKNLSKDTILKNLLVEAYRTEVPIAAICAAPIVLSEHNLLKGRRATCYPGFETDLKDFVHDDRPVVHDGALITGNGPGAAMAFALKIVEFLKGHKVSDQLAASMMFVQKEAVDAH